MAVFTCKMCGGNLEVIDATSGLSACESCGTKQTLPNEIDERKVNQFNRANHYRRNNEFDRAAEAYAKILDTDPGEAEAYWGLVLCRYGIEYVEDKKTMKRIPTCHRTLTKSILKDADYQTALSLAKPMARLQYEEEAKTIDRLQKEILSFAGKEEAFDVFISYKELDDQSGQRTPDSVLAQDIYDALTREGWKVFFSRITLEKRIGQQYEPIIYAALRSSKVMVVVGTKAQYLQAPWVRNEWNRYLGMMEEEPGSKTLIPVYRDMDPYDMPDEFSHLQGVNAASLGFIQDLTRGIKKLLGEGTQPASAGAVGTPLLERAQLFLENGDFENATRYSQRFLDIAPKDYRGYLVALMAELGCRQERQLAQLQASYLENANFKNAVRFAPPSRKEELMAYARTANERLSQQQYEAAYQKAQWMEQNANTQEDWEKAYKAYQAIGAQQESERCKQKLEQKILERAQEYEQQAEQNHELALWKNAAESYHAINATEKENRCREEFQKLHEETNALYENMMNWIRRRYRFSRWARIVKILCTVVLAVLAFVVGKQTYPLWSQDARSLIIIFWPFMVMMIILRIFFVGEDWEDFKSELIKYGITPILAGVLSYAVADATSFGSSIGSFLGTLFMTALFGLIGIPVGVILGFAIGSMFQPVVGNSFKAEKKKLLKEKQNINFEKNLSAVKNPDRTKLLLYHFL